MGGQEASCGYGPHPLSGSPGVLRRRNTNLVLQAVRAGGPLSRREIAEATGLSRPAGLSAIVPVPPTAVASGLGDEAVAQGAIRLARTTVEEQMDALTTTRTG